MHPLINRAHTLTVLRKSQSTTSASNEKISNEQLRSMVAPKHVNALQWNLSNPDERRKLYEHSSAIDKSSKSKKSNSVKAVKTNIRSSIAIPQLSRQQKTHGEFIIGVSHGPGRLPPKKQATPEYMARNAIAGRLNGPLSTTSNTTNQPTYSENLEQLIAKGKFGLAAKEVNRFLLLEEKNITLLGTYKQYKVLIENLTKLDGLSGDIKNGSWYDIDQKINSAMAELHKKHEKFGLENIFIQTRNVVRKLSGALTLSLDDYVKISPAGAEAYKKYLAHFSIPVTADTRINMGQVVAELFGKGQRQKAAGVVLSTATRLDVFQTELAKAMREKAAEMSPVLVDTDSVDQSSNGSTTIQSAIDEISTALGTPDQATQKEIEKIISSVKDNHYPQFLGEMKSQGMLDKLFNGYSKPWGQTGPMRNLYGYSYQEGAYHNLAITNPDHVLDRTKLYDAFANKGIAQIQSNDWFVKNINTVILNFSYGQNISDTQLTGIAQLSQMKGYETLASNLFAAFGGSLGYLKPFDVNRGEPGILGSKAEQRFLKSAGELLEKIQNQWNNTDEAGRRTLVRGWESAGKDKAISLILGGIDFADYHDVEGPLGVGSAEVNLEISKIELTDIDKSLKTLSQTVEKGLQKARKAEMEPLINPPQDYDDEGGWNFLQTKGLTQQEAASLIAKREVKLTQTYEVMSDTDLDAILAKFRTTESVVDNDEGGWFSIKKLSGFKAMIAFKVKLDRLRSKHTVLIGQGDAYQTTLNLNQPLTISHIQGLRNDIAKLDNQVFATGKTLENYQGSPIFGHAVSDNELKALGEQVGRSKDAFNQAIKDAKRALGEKIDGDWIFKPNKNLLEKAITLKADMRALRHQLSLRTDVSGVKKTLVGLNSGIKSVDQIIVAQRFATENAQWLENFTIKLLSDAGALDLGNVKVPRAVTATESEFNSAVRAFQNLQNDPSARVAVKLAVLTRVRTAALDLNRELQVFKGQVDDPIRKGVIDRHIGKLDTLIERLKPALSIGAGAKVDTNEVRQQVGAKLRELATDSPETFKRLITQVFGVTDAKKLETLLVQAQGESIDWIPEIRIVTAKTLKGNDAAYASKQDIIYLSENILNMPAVAFKAVLEELGHAIDVDLNGTVDTAGDEGELFSRLLSGERLSEKQILEIRGEQDTGTIIVDGVEIEVEFGLLSGFFDFIGDIFDKIFDFIKGVIDVIGDIIKGIGDLLVKLVSTPLFQVVAIGVSIFIPGSTAALLTQYAQAGAAIHAGIQNKDWGMVLQGLVTATVATSKAGSGSYNVETGVYRAPLLNLSLDTVKLLNNVAGWSEAALNLNNAIQLGESGVARFLLEELSGIPDNSPYAGLKGAGRLIEIGLNYHEADDDISKLSAVLQFVGVAGADSKAATLANALDDKVDVIDKIDKAINEKDWHAVHELTAGLISQYLPAETYDDVSDVLYIGASLATASDLFEAEQWGGFIKEVNNVGVGVGAWTGTAALENNLEVIANIIDKIEDINEIKSLIKNLKSSNPLKMIQGVIDLIKTFSDERSLNNLIKDPKLRQQIRNAIKIGEGIMAAWDKDNFATVATGLKRFVRVLLPSNTAVTELVDKFANQVFVPAALSVSLFRELDSSNPNYERVTALAAKLLGIELAVADTTQQHPAVKLIRSPEFEAKLTQLKEAIRNKDFGKMITLSNEIATMIRTALDESVTATAGINPSALTGVGSVNPVTQNPGIEASIDQLNSDGDLAIMRITLEGKVEFPNPTVVVSTAVKSQIGGNVKITQVGEGVNATFKVSLTKEALAAAVAGVGAAGATIRLESGVQQYRDVEMTFGSKTEAVKAVNAVQRLVIADVISHASVTSELANPLTSYGDPSIISRQITGYTNADHAFLQSHITAYETQVNLRTRFLLEAKIPEPVKKFFLPVFELRRDPKVGLTRRVELPKNGKPGKLTYTMFGETRISDKEKREVKLFGSVSALAQSRIEIERTTTKISVSYNFNPKKETSSLFDFSGLEGYFFGREGFAEDNVGLPEARVDFTHPAQVLITEAVDNRNVRPNRFQPDFVMANASRDNGIMMISSLEIKDIEHAYDAIVEFTNRDWKAASDAANSGVLFSLYDVGRTGADVQYGIKGGIKKPEISAELTLINTFGVDDRTLVTQYNIESLEVEIARLEAEIEQLETEVGL